MSDTGPDNDKYINDPRTPCKYGVKCYQKNPNHHEKYKHPPKKQDVDAPKHSTKKFKAETSTKEVKQVVTKYDVSDSDDYSIDESSTHSSDKSNKVDSDLSNGDANGSKTKHDKVTVSNDVSDSDDTDAESEKEQQTKRNDEATECHKFKKENKGEGLQNENQNSSDPKKFIKEKFLVEMPKDFYQFWEFCKKLKPTNPSDALKDVGLTLVGPFDVLAGKFDNTKKSDEEYLLHWRYYHDPPEFQTVLKGDDKTGYHIGYFRDEPEEFPVLLANNSAKKDGILHQMGGNIFTAVNMYLNELKKSGDPFKKMHIGKIQAAIKKEAEKLKIELSEKTDAMVAREKKIVTRTFNKIGLVVPFDRKSQVGYRELALSNKDLDKLFTKLQKALPEQKQKILSELQPVFTFASIATDECDFGTGIELGWNIIAHGVGDLDSTALRSLATNYRLLNRDVFAKIAEAHLKKRNKGCNLSII